LRTGSIRELWGKARLTIKSGDDRRIDIYDPSNVEALAKGGIVRGPRHALIGEAGPEAVIPLSKARSGKQSISLSATST
jgi:SLT domain-containing protein